MLSFFIFTSVCGLIWLVFAAYIIRSWRPIVFTFFFTPVFSFLTAVAAAFIARLFFGVDSADYGGLAVLAAFYIFGVISIPLAIGISMIPNTVWPLDIRRASVDQIMVRKLTRYAGCVLISSAILPTLMLFIFSKLGIN